MRPLTRIQPGQNADALAPTFQAYHFAMNEWLKAHTYLADWIAALSGILVTAPTILRTAEKVWTLTLCCFLVVTLLLALRLPSSPEAEETAKRLAFIVLVVAVAFSLRNSPEDNARALQS
jgi:hypothetical protein